MRLPRTALIRRLPAWLCVAAVLAGMPHARAGDPPASDLLLSDHWRIDVDATMLGLSEAVSLDLDALAPAERAEELLRRETFLKALRLAVAADGTFILGVERSDTRPTRETFDPRATRGTWTAVGLRRYRFTLTSRFGVATSKADAAPFDARIDLVRDRKRDPKETLQLGELALSFRDRDGTRLVFLRDMGNVGSAILPPTPPPPPAPAPSTPELSGSHPAAYVATWSLDRDRMVDVALALARKQLDGLEPEQRKLAQALLDGDAARDQMRRQFEVMEIDVVLRADGTLGATLLLPGRDQETATGTWRETDGKVVLTIVTKDGRPATESDRKPVTARLDGGLLWLELTEGEAAAIPLRRWVR